MFFSKILDEYEHVVIIESDADGNSIAVKKSTRIEKNKENEKEKWCTFSELTNRKWLKK